MGLDAVEFVFALEDAFGIAIPDPVAESMATPRLVVDYLVHRLPVAPTASCHTQHAFYRLRSTVARVYDLPARSIRPSTEWNSILPSRCLNRSWNHLRRAAGLPDFPRYRILWWQPPVSQTVGGTASYIASRTPHLFKTARLRVDQTGAGAHRQGPHRRGVRHSSLRLGCPLCA